MSSSFAERIQCAAARLLTRLPDRVKIRLSGESPVIIDGHQLDPQLQLLRAIRRRRGVRGLLDPSIAAGRARYRHETRVFRGPTTAVAAVHDLEIAGAIGPLRARHYIPPESVVPTPLTVYLHGGGFVIGDLDTHDEPCRMLCRHGGVQVLSVEYRLAPEHPFPAAVEDALAALRWAQRNATALGVDPRRIAMGGDSAGANLAAVVSTLTEAAERPAAQLLIYPATDVHTARASHQLFAESFVLTLADRDAFYRHYTAAQPHAHDPRLSVIQARNLSQLPPTLIALAGFDILRDEGEAFAAALLTAGVEVRVMRFHSLEHGFIHLAGVCTTARVALIGVGQGWGRMVRQLGQLAQSGITG